MLYLALQKSYMKILRLIILTAILLSACRTIRQTTPATSVTRSEYITKYSDIAIREMRRTGIPASIKMAQAILESGDGNSTLARRGNNHFGIKCHGWTGRRIYHDDDERNECFRRYSTPEESFLDHSEFLTSRPRYAGLFKLDPHDYRGWARGLKAAGYATNPQYDRLLIRIIEDNQLYKLDAGISVSPRAGKVVETRKGVIDEMPAAGSRRIQTRNRIKYIIANEGDTYESITSEMGLMSWELARYNDIPRGSSISPGDIVYLQPKRIRAQRGMETHKVSKGETMWHISQLYGIRLERLLRRNYMQKGEEPSPGQIIYLRN